MSSVYQDTCLGDWSPWKRSKSTRWEVKTCLWYIKSSWNRVITLGITTLASKARNHWNGVSWHRGTPCAHRVIVCGWIMEVLAMVFESNERKWLDAFLSSRDSTMLMVSKVSKVDFKRFDSYMLQYSLQSVICWKSQRLEKITLDLLHQVSFYIRSCLWPRVLAKWMCYWHRLSRQKEKQTNRRKKHAIKSAKYPISNIRAKNKQTIKNTLLRRSRPCICQSFKIRVLDHVMKKLLLSILQPSCLWFVES